MKLFVLLAGLLAVSSAYGQYMGGRRPGMSAMNQPTDTYRPSAFSTIPNILAERETSWLRDSLSLSKEQMKAVKKLNQDYARQQQDAIKDIVGTKGGQPTPEAVKQVREAMTMLNDEKQDGLRPILTPEQWKTYVAKRALMWQQTGGFYEKGFTKLN